MKKLLATFAIILVLAPVMVQAQYGQLSGTQPTDYTTSQGGSSATSGGTSLNQVPSTFGNGTPSNVQNAGDIGCSINNIAICISNLVYYPMVGLGSWFAYIAAFFFDYAVVIALNSASYAGPWIAGTWQLIRDIANMLFLFILIYIGYTIMLRADTAGTSRLLVGLIVAALLVNFSFLITRIVIDTGNILAVQFYNAINAPSINQSAAASGVGGFSAVTGATAAGGETKDLTAAVMNALNIQTITSNANFQNYAKSADANPMYTLITLSAIYVVMGVMFFILAGSFLYAGVKFIVRTVGLWVVIMFAPFAMVMAIFRWDKNPLSSWGNIFQIWLSYLFKYTFYPAVYLCMFWVLTLFADSVAQAGLLNTVFNNTAAGGGSFISIANALANVGVRLGFLVAMLYLMLSIADKIQPFANGAAGWVQGKILSGAAGGFIGGLGRGTFGLAGAGVSGLQRWRGPQTVNGRKETEDEFRKRVDNSIWSGMSKRTYDIRNAPLVGTPLTKGLGAVSKGTSVLSSKFGTLGVNFGEPAKAETWEAQRKRVVAREQVNEASAEQANRQNAVKGLFRAARNENREREAAVGTLYTQRMDENVAGQIKSRKAVEELYKAAKSEEAKREKAVGQLYTQKVDEDVAKQIAGRKAVDSLYKSAQRESATEKASAPANAPSDNGVFLPAGASRPATSSRAVNADNGVFLPAGEARPTSSPTAPTNTQASAPTTVADNGVFQPAGAVRPTPAPASVTNVTNVTHVTKTTNVTNAAPAPRAQTSPSAISSHQPHSVAKNGFHATTEARHFTEEELSLMANKLAKKLGPKLVASTPDTEPPPAAPAAQAPKPQNPPDYPYTIAAE